MFSRALRSRPLRAAVAVGALSSAMSAPALAEDSRDASDDVRMSKMSQAELFRTFVVYKACQFPSVIDSSPAILGTLLSVPVLKQITELVVRHSFFSQFVGGDTALECLPVVRRLREEGIGCLFAYSVEVSHEESEAHGLEINAARRTHAEAHVEETVRAIEVAGAENRRHAAQSGVEDEFGSTWVAVKLTGLMADPAVLLRLSNTIFVLRDSQENISPDAYYPGTPSDPELSIVTSSPSPHPFFTLPEISDGLAPSDLVELGRLRDDMRLIMKAARQHGVRIIVDSEHTWLEPAVNAITVVMSSEFNRSKATIAKDRLSRSGPRGWLSSFSILSASLTSDLDYPDVQPLIYGTYQSYLRRNPSHLHHSLDRARRHSYCLGVKLVRGAYHDQEATRWRETLLQKSPPPVWEIKSETDACYDACAQWLLDRLAEDMKSGNEVPGLGVLFGTHNEESVRALLGGLTRRKMATKVEEQDGKLRISKDLRKRLCFGQLYGMADPLTHLISSTFDSSSSASPLVLKYLPYGALVEVLPYLGRRAVENKTVLSGEGGARVETERAWREIKRRYVWA